mgnify:CR=1 FL=1
MMVFNLTDEHQLVRQTAREFAEQHLKPIAAELDQTARFPAEIVKQMAELGFMGIAIPEAYGGAGMDYLSYALVVEEISRVCGSTGVILSAHSSLACDPINANGTEEQKNKFLTPMASGKKIGCFGLTEPAAGSDAGSLKTSAVLEKDEWVLNGSKIFITNGAEAEVAVVFAVTDREKGAKGISALSWKKAPPAFPSVKRKKN